MVISDEEFGDLIDELVAERALGLEEWTDVEDEDEILIT